MQKYSRLSQSSDFSKIYKTAKKWHCDSAVVYFLANENIYFAAVASKKIGNAVERNRAKRRLRAMFSEICGLIKEGSYVMVAKNNINLLQYDKALKNLRWALGKIGAFK